MQCIIMENTLIKLTLHDETKKRAHDSQIVRNTRATSYPVGTTNTGAIGDNKDWFVYSGYY